MTTKEQIETLRSDANDREREGMIATAKFWRECADSLESLSKELEQKQEQIATMAAQLSQARAGLRFALILRPDNVTIQRALRLSK